MQEHNGVDRRLRELEADMAVLKAQREERDQKIANLDKRIGGLTRVGLAILMTLIATLFGIALNVATMAAIGRQVLDK